MQTPTFAEVQTKLNKLQNLSEQIETVSMMDLRGHARRLQFATNAVLHDLLALTSNLSNELSETLPEDSA